MMRWMSGGVVVGSEVMGRRSAASPSAAADQVAESGSYQKENGWRYTGWRRGTVVSPSSSALSTLLARRTFALVEPSPLLILALNDSVALLSRLFPFGHPKG